MTATNQKQLDSTLWSIASQLRGAMIEYGLRKELLFRQTHRTA